MNRRGSTLRRGSTATSVTDSNRSPNCYAWGWPDDGRLGLGEDLGAHDSKAPAGKPPLKGVRHQVWPHPNFCFSSQAKDMVTAAAGGNRHTLFAMASGRVTGAGWNKHGQLGTDPAKTDYEGRSDHACYHPVAAQGAKEGGRDVFFKAVEAGDATR